jgi:PAS domain S-box-containing protein
MDKNKKLHDPGAAQKVISTENKENKKLSKELSAANKELDFQNKEKEKRADELVIANKELAFQNQEKEKRADELVIANKELAFQNKEKRKRAAELVIANKELAFQEKEKKKRANELLIANKKLRFENKEKVKRAIELENAQRKLEKKESQFRFVLTSAPIAMLLIDKNAVITYINRKAEILFGYEQTELIDKRFEFCIPDINAGNTRNEYTALTKSGREMMVEINLIPVEAVQGLMILVCVNDISERRELTVSQSKQKESDVKNREIEQFAYVTTHDLQEPLRTVSNYIQLFEKNYVAQLDDNAIKYIHSINSATKRMSTLVKSILGFSRIGHTNKKTTYIDCRNVLDEVLADLDVIINESKTIIEIGKMPHLNVYETEFHQLFQNLITNAIKFCKKGNPPSIKISAQQENEKWKFSVCDSGIGISPIHFNKVFDIFQRVNPDNEYAGHGIGLANCKKIVQFHHGEIWVESVLGQGATFYFTIPNLPEPSSAK